MSVLKRLGQGLALLVILLVLVWVFVVDWWIEREIEARGTEAVGARVDLDAADLTAFPPGIELLGLAVTNPSSPMKNAVEIRRIAGRMDGRALLSLRYIVDALDIEGVRFATDRTVSGAIAGAAPPPAASSTSFAVPNLEIPDVKSILENEDLASLRIIKDLEAELQGLQGNWKGKLDGLPDESAFAGYQERIEGLISGDPLRAATEIEALRKDIKRDLKSVEQASKDLDQQVREAKAKLEAARQAPFADVRRLQERYALTPAGIANLSASLLGEPVAEMVREAVAWSERLEEMVAGGDEPAAESSETPDFLVRLSRVSVELERGTIDGTIHDITANQPAFGRPTTFAFASDAVPGLGSLTLDGVLDRVDPTRPADRAALVVRGFDAAGVSLSQSPAWPISIERGNADIDANIALGAGDALDASASLSLRDAGLKAPFPGTDAVARALGGAVENVRTLSMKVVATGTTQDYALTITSNLDSVLKDAVGGLLRREAERFARELEKGILEKTSGPLAALASEQQELLGFTKVLDQRETAGERALDIKPGGLGKKFKLF